MSFDLPNPPKGYKTDLALIIAPYFDAWFAKRAMDRLKPKRIRFLVDDGARADDLEQLRKQCPRTEIGLGCTTGVVHLKAYYLVFVKSTGGRHRRTRRFLFGSANATRAAFDGETNAELLAEVDLSPSGDKQLIAYLENILAAISNGSGQISGVALAHNERLPALFLPKFRIKRPGAPPAFDAWLQRGKLAAKYRDPQQFMKIAVELEKPLPPERVAQLFANRGLAPQGKRNIVRYSYAGAVTEDEYDTTEVTDENDNGAAPQWISKYCVWTHLGYWLSEECYKSKGPKGENVLTSKSTPKREGWIRTLEENVTHREWKNEKKQRFLDVLRGTWEDLRSIHINPSDYLKNRNGHIDVSEYGRRFDKKLATDLFLARDEDFKRRYILGYEFVDVPRFREDAIAWQDFVRSWCESIAVEAAKTGKGRTRSLVTQTVRDAVDPNLSKFSRLSLDAIRDKLRGLWNSGDSVGDIVWAKWAEDGLFYRGKVAGLMNEKLSIRYDDNDREPVRRQDVNSIGEFVSCYFDLMAKYKPLHSSAY